MSAAYDLNEVSRIRKRAVTVQAELRRRRRELMRKLREAGFTAKCHSCGGPCHPTSSICAHCIID